MIVGLSAKQCCNICSLVAAIQSASFGCVCTCCHRSLSIGPVCNVNCLLLIQFCKLGCNCHLVTCPWLVARLIVLSAASCTKADSTADLAEALGDTIVLDISTKLCPIYAAWCCMHSVLHHKITRYFALYWVHPTNCFLTLQWGPQNETGNMFYISISCCHVNGTLCSNTLSNMKSLIINTFILIDAAGVSTKALLQPLSNSICSSSQHNYTTRLITSCLLMQQKAHLTLHF